VLWLRSSREECLNIVEIFVEGISIDALRGRGR